jgi:hypothetical protein
MIGELQQVVSEPKIFFILVLVVFGIYRLVLELSKYLIIFEFFLGVVFFREESNPQISIVPNATTYSVLPNSNPILIKPL